MNWRRAEQPVVSKETRGDPAVMGIERGDQATEAQIAVHWKEEEYVRPPARFIAQANLADPAVRERFREERFPECFREYADLLTWDRYWHSTLDTTNPPFWRYEPRGSSLRNAASPPY